jgi:hypothetical protein
LAGSLDNALWYGSERENRKGVAPSSIQTNFMFLQYYKRVERNLEHAAIKQAQQQGI